KVQNIAGRSAGANTVIWSLIATGYGKWEEHREEINQPFESTSTWWPMEVNGDGRTDLVHITRKPGEIAVISTMLSLGNGQWDAVHATQASALSPDNGALASYRVVDLDGDGRDDLVYFINFLTSTGGYTTKTVTVWNRYPNYFQTVSDDLP